jgi:hypothetical protein
MKLFVSTLKVDNTNLKLIFQITDSVTMKFQKRILPNYFRVYYIWVSKMHTVLYLIMTVDNKTALQTIHFFL